MDSIPQLLPVDLSKLPAVASSEPGVQLVGYDQDNPPRLVRVALDEITKSISVRVTVANQAARYALTADDVQNGDYVKQTDTGVLYEVTDDTNLGNANGWTAMATLPWSAVTDKPAVIGAGSTQELARQQLGLGVDDQPVWSSLTVGTADATGDILFAHDSGTQLDTLRPTPGAADRVILLPAASGTLATTADIVGLNAGIPATRAVASYGINDGATSNRGVVYSGATRHNIAGLPVWSALVMTLVPSAPSTAEIWGQAPLATATALSQAWAHVLAWSGNDLIYQQNGAVPATDFRRITWTGLRTTYSATRTSMELVVTQGSATAPVLRIGNSLVSGTASDGAGTDPDWLSASGSYAAGVSGYGYPQQEHPHVVPVIGVLSTAERTEYFSTGRVPAWVTFGGTAVGLVTNTGFEVDTTGWAASGGTIARTIVDANTGVASLEVVSTTSGNGVRTDIGTAPTTRVHVIQFWAKSVSGNTTLTVSRSNGSSGVNFTLTGAWQKFTYTSNAGGTLISSAGTNLALFYLNGAGTFRLDDVQIWQGGATTFPAYQPLPVVRDMTTIGGNQGRMVGVTPVLFVAQDASRIEVSSQAFTAATSVQILGGVIIGSKSQRIISVTGNSSASTTISIGTSNGGTQLVATQAVNGNFDISTFVARLIGSGNSVWVTFAGNTTASVVINVSDI